MRKEVLGCRNNKIKAQGYGKYRGLDSIKNLLRGENVVFL